MSRATPSMRNFSERLIGHATKGKFPSRRKSSPAFHVCEKLRPHLATLMGNAGFRALLARALALARAEVSWLRVVNINVEGSLEVAADLFAGFSAIEVREGGVVLVAQLLGLLVAFIGENLTLRTVREVWPTLPLQGLDFSKGDSK